MKIILSILLAIISFCGMYGADNSASSRIFATSRSLDMIASLQYFDKISDKPRFRHLADDSVFMQNLEKINETVTASNLCNFYTLFKGDKNNTDSCVSFFSGLHNNDEVINSESQWILRILGLQTEISGCLEALNSAGYNDYWEENVKPRLSEYIENYPVSDSILDAIHIAMTELSGPEDLPETHSNTYVLDIDNAFNLSDESFCCTPLLLDPEMEKKFRLDFLKVYTHENLHRLRISDSLVDLLENLKKDDFYRVNEEVASSHGEGLNEAFVVAAEVYISHKIGRRDSESVYREFKEYVDGSLVLAPIVYIHLPEKRVDETFNDFLIGLFNRGDITPGNVKAEYERAMSTLKAGVN